MRRPSLRTSLLTGMVLISSAAVAQDGRAFAVQDALALQQLRFDRAGLSPDGDWIAYALTDGYWERSQTSLDRVVGSGNTHVFVRPLSGRTRPLTRGSTYSWMPVWSPDGDKLAFYLWKEDSIHIGVWSRSEDDVAFYAAPEVSGRSPVQWHPAGGHLLYKAQPAPQPGSREPYDTEAYVNAIDSEEEPQPYDGRSLDARSYGIDVLDLATGSTRVLATPTLVNLQFQVSPDGARVLTEHAVKNGVWVARVTPTNEVAVLTWADGKRRVLIDETTVHGMSWTPDGSAIAYADEGSLRIVPVDGGDAERLGDPAVQLGGPPTWTPDGESAVLAAGSELYAVDLAGGNTRRLTSGLAADKSAPVFSPDGETMWFLTTDPETLAEGVGSVAAAGGEARQVIRADAAIAELGVAADGSLVFTRQTFAVPEDVWALDPQSGGELRLTETNAQLAGVAMASSRLLRWKSAEGEDLRGVLILPPGYRPDRRYPVVVWVYETFSSQLHHFESHLYNLQVLAGQGYAVLMPDVVFETGATAHSYLSCVLPALDRLEETGVANGRYGLMGHSFGGFATNMITTGTDRFRASIAIAGISDWIGMYGYPGDFMRLSHERGQARLGGTPWEVRSAYIENSPVFHLDRITTPIMIVHGMQDRGVPFHQAEAMYYGLRRLGKTATLVAYPGEGHLYWSMERRVLLDMWSRILAWFDEYVGRD